MQSKRCRAGWVGLMGLAAVLAVTPVRAEVVLARVFGDHMVLQREMPVPVWGRADPGEQVTVAFGGQTAATVAGADGTWRVRLDPMPASAQGRELTVTGRNTVTFRDVLVGEVWICSGQSNMDMRLSGCNRPEDIASADYPGIRHFLSAGGAADAPRQDLPASAEWVVSRPATAGQFTAAGFYFARKIQQEFDGEVPVGLMLASVGGTKIDLWLAPEGIHDLPVLHPLLQHRPLADGTFSLFNGLVAPLAPYAVRGVLWYQGENCEVTRQSPDSYYLKMRALIEGWKKVWGQADMAFYCVLLANYGELLDTVTPVLRSGGWDADTRLQQVRAMGLPHAGCASAMDIGVSKVSWAGYHPENKLDVGERLALWALKNEFGRADLVPSGPVLRSVAVAGRHVVCTFDYVGSGLMVGRKAWYEPTEEVAGGTLQRFSIAGAEGPWHAADAVIRGDRVVLSSPEVAEPRRVSYASWQNPEGANLYNRDGLPAVPFHVEDVTVEHAVTASAGPGGRISPEGAQTYLHRATVRYTITPDEGYFIQDVRVDGESVGSVPHFTFDPLYQDHTIAATFSRNAPEYTVTVSADGGGRVVPSGEVKVAQGGTVEVDVVPEPGNRVILAVNGVAIGPRERFVFADVRSDQTLSATFACTVRATAGFGGIIAPSGDLVVPFGGDQAFTITPQPGYAIAGVEIDGQDAGLLEAYTFDRVTASHSIHVTFRATAAAQGRIPRPEQVLLAARAADLPAAGETGAWPAQVPEGERFTPMGHPVVEQIDGRKYARIDSEKGTGYAVGTFDEAIPCEGATIVAVARPVRSGKHSGWVSVVDIFYDRLTLGIHGDSGRVCIRRNGGIENSEAVIPEGQITILSYVVQPDGSYKVHANGVEIMSGDARGEMTALVPGVDGRGFARSINIGRNAPDSWTTFNGHIGDVFVYKVALTDAERRELEAHIAASLHGGDSVGR